MVRAIFMPMVLRLMAACNSARGTNSGVTAPQAGIIIAVPMPRAKVNNNNSGAVVKPASVKPPNSVAVVIIQIWMTIKYRRRSTMSASAPAGTASRNTGAVVAACTSATISGVGASEVIN